MNLREFLQDHAWIVPYVYLVTTFWFFTDDSLISLRYAGNLAAGEGLRYNPGESPPVEGYSNLLWVLLWAGALKLGVFSLPAVLAVSASCGAALLVLVRRRLEDPLGFAPPVARLVTAALAAFPPFAVWATGGLATMPYALLVFVAFDRLVLAPRIRAVPAAAALVLLLLIRSEGFIWCAVILALAAAYRADRRPLALPAVAFAAAFAGLTAWRLDYHGAFWSGPALAKTEADWSSFGVGARYVLSHAAVFVTPLLVPVAAVAAARRGPARWWVPVIVLAFLPALFAVAVGGDFMAMGRFLVPGFAFAALLGAAALSALPAGVPRTATGAAVILCALLPAVNVHIVPEAARRAVLFRHGMEPFLSEYDYWQYQRDNAAGWREKGNALKEYLAGRPFANPHPVYVTMAIGAVGFYSGAAILDRAGLVTPESRAPEFRNDADLSLPGHRYAPPVSFFLDREPEILWARLLRRRGARFVYGACARALKHRDIPTDRYVLDFRPVADGNTLLLWRKIDGDAEAAWAGFNARMDSLRTGSLLSTVESAPQTGLR